jgi:hypothetical protein
MSKPLMTVLSTGQVNKTVFRYLLIYTATITSGSREHREALADLFTVTLSQTICEAHMLMAPDVRIDLHLQLLI